MAGDWMPLRLDIHDDPAVLAIAGHFEESPALVVGILTQLWVHGQRHAVEGRLRHAGLRTIDALLGYPGFAKQLVRVGWLVVDGGDVVLPNWHRWNSQSAKGRLMATQRKQKERVAEPDPAPIPSHNCHASTVTETRQDRDRNATRGEKSTEEEKIQTPSDSPPSSSTTLFGPESEPPAKPAKTRLRKQPSEATQILKRQYQALVDIWPRKRSLDGAEKAWLDLAPDEALQERIRADVEARRHSHDWTKEGKKYVPSIATYLRGRYWEEQAYGPDVSRLERRGRVESPEGKYAHLSQPTPDPEPAEQVSAPEAADRGNPYGNAGGGPFGRPRAASDAPGD